MGCIELWMVLLLHVLHQAFLTWGDRRLAIGVKKDSFSRNLNLSRCRARRQEFPFRDGRRHKPVFISLLSFTIMLQFTILRGKGRCKDWGDGAGTRALIDKRKQTAHLPKVTSYINTTTFQLSRCVRYNRILVRLSNKHNPVTQFQAQAAAERVKVSNRHSNTDLEVTEHGRALIGIHPRFPPQPLSEISTHLSCEHFSTLTRTHLYSRRT